MKHFRLRSLIAALLFVASNSQGFVPHLPSQYDVSVGQTVVVQLRATSTGPDIPFNIASVDARLSYNASALAFVSASAGSALIGGTQPPVVVANDTGSEVVVAIAVIQPQPLQEDGLLLQLEFIVQPGISDQTIIDLVELSLNEGVILHTGTDVADEDGIVSTGSEAGSGSSILSIIIAICSKPDANC